jgi:hypothetical protein
MSKIKSFTDLFGNDDEPSSRTVEIPIGHNALDQEMRLKIMEMGSPAFQKLYRKMDRALETSRRKPKKRKRIWAEIVAKTVLLSWSNILDDDDKPVEPTYENRFNALVEHEGLLRETMDIAGDPAAFAESDDEIEAGDDTEKNLKKSSSGRSKTAKT